MAFVVSGVLCSFGHQYEARGNLGDARPECRRLEPVEIRSSESGSLQQGQHDQMEEGLPEVGIVKPSGEGMLIAYRLRSTASYVMCKSE